MSGDRRRVSIFGSTGSIGCNTIDLIARSPDQYEVIALTGASSVDRLAEQARQFDAKIAVTADESRYKDLKQALSGSGTKPMAGADALIEAASEPTDWTMSAIVGAAGIPPTLTAAARGGTLALANKESVVAAGALLASTCARAGTTLLPVDSEHSAIFQCLRGERAAEVERILLTASGGPFRTWTTAQMAAVTPEQARSHPNWSMGVRISIDSATMFNKALEMIETQLLFKVAPQAVEVVVHPQSIVHSMVGFADGSVMAQLGPPDMRGAIGFALNWPDRAPLPVDRLDLAALARLDFEAPDTARFPSLRLAREVMTAGGLSGAAFNAAKEAALDAFLDGRIGFLDMARLVQHVLDSLAPFGHETAYVLGDVLEMDARARSLGARWAERNGKTVEWTS